MSNPPVTAGGTVLIGSCASETVPLAVAGNWPIHPAGFHKVRQSHRLHHVLTLPLENKR